jgi:hypothetical protein
MHTAHARVAATIFLLLILPACSSEPEKGASKPAVRAVTVLPSPPCRKAGSLPPGGQVSFVAGVRLFVVSATGAGGECIGEFDSANPVQWAPAGDRYLVAGFDVVNVYSGATPQAVTGLGSHPRTLGFSRPRGGNVLFVSVDGATLSKASTWGGRAVDISFLRRHDEATYHPSGAQIAVIGASRDGRYGIWLATNEGKEARLVVPVSTQDEFYGLAYSYDGSSLFYVADEHDHWDLRSLDLSVAKPEPTKLLSADSPITAPVVSLLSSDTVAYRQGDCDTGMQTYVADARGPRIVAAGKRDTQPVGWMPDGTLVVAVSDDLCDIARSLDLYVVNEDKESLLVKDVLQAAVRVAYPPPPAPPEISAGDPAGE